MRVFFRISLTVMGICSVLWLASAARAQAILSPRISHLMPMGGQAGTTFDLRITGQDLKDVEGLHFNFPGVQAEMLGSDKSSVEMKGKPAPALTVHRFKVTLPASAPLGIQDVRIITRAGVSNPRAFVVGDQKEFVEQEPNDDVPKAQKIELNSTVNGVISVPTDVDYYAFTGKKGQRVVCACLTTSIDSKLPVALQLYGADGSYLGFNRSYAGNDAVLDATLPADGEYFVRVFGFTYTQGGVDYFYRLTVSTAPWVDAVFPPVLEPGKETQVTVYGRNLPGGKLDPAEVFQDRPLEKVVVTLKAPEDPDARQRLAHTGFIPPSATMIDGFDFRMKNEAGSSHPYLLTYAPAPVVLDQGDNDTPSQAQKIALPCVIAGRIEKKADRDWYAFTARKGQVWNIEAFSERLGAPLDLFFQLHTEKGGLITEQDDNPEVMSPHFFTRSDDPPRFRFSVPADGTYTLMVTSRDAFTQASPRHLYTVRITPEEPDFRLVAMPPSMQQPEGLIVPQSGGAAYTVYVWRLGGFTGEIALSGENLPPGFSVPPQLIASGQKQAMVVLQAEPGAKPWTGPIHLVGTAQLKDQKIVRAVRSATVSWPVPQANIPTITRLDRELVLAVRGRVPYRLVVSTPKVNVLQGEKISIPVTLEAEADLKVPVQVTLVNGPVGLNALPSTLSASNKGGAVTLDPKGGAAIAPGNYTIFVRGQTQPAMAKQPAPKGVTPNYVQISMPVLVTIVPRQLAKVTTSPASVKLSVGKQVEVTVKVVRQFDLPLVFKLQAVLPPNLKGVTVQEATLLPGEEEGKLIFTASPEAVIGMNPSITIRATAMFNDTIPVVHETKMVLAISK